MVISIVNYKGGTGKTTIAFHLSHSLEFLFNKNKKKKKMKILLIDNDPQASLTKLFYNPEEDFDLDKTILAIYEERPVYSEEIIYKTKNENIFLVPNIYLTVRKNDLLSSAIDGFFRLKFFIEKIKDGFDLILIDNNPTSTNFTKNSFIASDYILIPTEPTKMSTEGIKEILEDFNIVRKTVNKNIKLLGILINRLDRRYTSHKIFKEVLYKAFGELILDTEITQRAFLQNLEVRKIPITHYKQQPSYKEFLMLAKEIAYKVSLSSNYDAREVLKMKYKEEII